MRKNLKKTLCMLLSLLMVLSVFGVVAVSADTETVAVTFDAVNDDDPVTVNIDKVTVPARPAIPVRDGHTFKGWKFGDKYEYYDFATPP